VVKSSTHGRNEKCIKRFGRRTMNDDNNLEDMGVEVRIILNISRRNRM
jgi:hypothetical protein